ncbi:hypothetical protein ZWY2020_048993 [Hordeum vulgare]|nr:hypothetical protein ZWY2020_048993 [Hordeum vulgare]
MSPGKKGVMAPRAAVLLVAMAVASVFFASASAQGIMAPSSAPAPAPDAGAAAGLAPVSAVAVVASALVSLLAATLLQ